MTAASNTIRCPRCQLLVNVRGRGARGVLVEHCARGWRCSGSGMLATPIRLERLAAEVEAAKQREAFAEAALAEATARAAEARARCAALLKRMDELRAQEIEIGTRLAMIEAVCKDGE